MDICMFVSRTLIFEWDICVWLTYLCNFIGTHKFCPSSMDFCCTERWFLSSLPLSDLMRRKMKILKLLGWHLYFLITYIIYGIVTHSVDAAATGGQCSRGNSSQTPSRCSWALTPGWTGPCCQSPSDEPNTNRKSTHCALNMSLTQTLSCL